MQRRSVVFPAPLDPTSATISSEPTRTSTPPSARSSPYAALRSRTSSTRLPALPPLPPSPSAQYASTTAGSTATAAGVPSAIFSPGAQDDDPVREVQQGPHDVLHEHQGASPRPRTRRMTAIASAVSRGSQPGHELVEQQEVRSRGERAGQLETPPLDEAQARARRCPFPSRPTRARKRPASRSAPPPALRRRPCRRPTRTLSIAAEAGKRAHVLEGPRRPRARSAGEAVSRVTSAPQADPAAVGPEHARDQVEERRLAGAVRPHDADDGAGRDLDAHAANRLHAREGLGDAFEGEQGLGARHAELSPRPPLSAWSTAAPGRRAAGWRTPSARPAPACR